MIKTDIDGLDADLIREILQLKETENSILLFELDHSFYGRNWKVQFIDLFVRLEELKYCLIVVDNFGRPMMSLESNFVKLIQLYTWINSQKNLDFKSVYYLDIWAFPKSKIDVFTRIVKIEKFNE